MNNNEIIIQNMTTDFLLDKRPFPTTQFKSPKEYAFYKKFHAEKDKEIANRHVDSEEKERNQTSFNISE